AVGRSLRRHVKIPSGTPASLHPHALPGCGRSRRGRALRWPPLAPLPTRCLEGARMGSKQVTMRPEFRRFLGRLQRELHPQVVVLFGSRARGDPRPDSDYDLLVISNRFRRVPWVQRAALVTILWDLPLDVDAICLTPA